MHGWLVPCPQRKGGTNSVIFVSSMTVRVEEEGVEGGVVYEEEEKEEWKARYGPLI